MRRRQLLHVGGHLRQLREACWSRWDSVRDDAVIGGYRCVCAVIRCFVRLQLVMAASVLAASCGAEENGEVVSSQPPRHAAVAPKTQDATISMPLPVRPMDGGASPEADRFDADLADLVTKRGLPALKKCLSAKMPRDTDVSGRITVTLTIGKTGDATDVAVVGVVDTVADCLVEAFRKMHFTPQRTPAKLALSIVF